MKLALAELTQEAVLKAIAEFDLLSRSAFLKKYGFKEARRYFLEYNGALYDSKAIAGVAHSYLGAEYWVLSPKQFRGGELAAAKKLRELGFNVSASRKLRRNPPWSRDELILALDLYMTNPLSPPSKSSREVHELCQILNTLGRKLNRRFDHDYRNPNGVYMKMMNFRRFDPNYTTSGKVGLRRGNKDEAIVWKTFVGDRERLASVAAAIKASLRLPEGAIERAVDEDFEAEEGRLLTVLHVKRERDRRIVEKKKKKALAKFGILQCEACGFVFEHQYGARGRNYIEVHHVKPVHTLMEGSKTSLNDLALVCSNCHRMIHRAQPWLTIEELRLLLRKAASSRATAT